MIYFITLCASNNTVSYSALSRNTLKVGQLFPGQQDFSSSWNVHYISCSEFECAPNCVLSIGTHDHRDGKKSNCSSRIAIPFMDVHFGVIHSRTLLENLLSVIVTHSSVLLTPIESYICDERNWPYQCGVSQICLQLDEQSSCFPQQYCYCHCQ